MKVQKGELTNGQTIWLVLDDNFLPVEPISKYLRYLDSLNRSPNTIAAYARNLKLYWEYLQQSSLDWKQVNLEQLSEFIHWLRNPDPGTIPLHPKQAKRSEKTINHALTTVTSFYEFHERLGTTKGVEAYRLGVQRGSKYKPFLHHISQGKLTRTRLLKVKESKTFPGCLGDEEVKTLINACNRIRDKFLVCLLSETGMRIGEALGLRHEDMVTGGKNEIQIEKRLDNVNKARAKGYDRIVHVNQELMRLYSDYLIEEYPEDIDSDYVFISIWGHQVEPGVPLKYSAVDSLFRRLSKKTGIYATPHLLRHSHATNLIRAKWDMSYVKKRLGHSDIQTTVNTYVHLLDDDLKVEYQKYLQQRKEHVRFAQEEDKSQKITDRN